MSVVKEGINGFDNGFISLVVDVKMKDMVGRLGCVLISVDVSFLEGVD